MPTSFFVCHLESSISNHLRAAEQMGQFHLRKFSVVHDFPSRCEMILRTEKESEQTNDIPRMAGGSRPSDGVFNQPTIQRPNRKQACAEHSRRGKIFH